VLSADHARQALERAWGGVLTTLDALPGEHWALGTRCPGWDVDALVRHLVWGVTMEADALRRARTGSSGAAQGRTAPGARRDVTAELRRGVDDLLAEVAALPPTAGARPLPLPYGDVPTALALQVFVMEAGVHGDDLSSALGRDEALHPDVVAGTAAALAAVLPAMAAATDARPPAGTVVAVTGPSVGLRFALEGDQWVAAGSGEPTGEVVADDDGSALRFVLGRVGPDGPGLTVRGDDVVAAGFKRWFPGP
jgi:uncharacterized protein (TIGR03083 family)